ncbi:hypothetical protein LZK73_31465 (plasmid) [Neorhizobium galegae]|nr:hypothetical protein LZK73_31465 [Neorhizobium galegae]
MPPSAIAIMDGTYLQEISAPPEAILQEVVDENPILSRLTRSEREKLAQSGIEREYREGDVIVAQEQALPWMMIIRTGVVSMQHEEQEKDAFPRAISLGKPAFWWERRRPTRCRP